MSLRQAFAHCARFPAAASRRSGGRVSVPLWPFVLSHRLLVLGLVGHYPTNYLISRKLLPKRPKPFFQSSGLEREVRGIRPDFSGLSPSLGQITYVLLSRPPLTYRASPGLFVRLACIRRTASVRPEPGSNSKY